MTKDDIKLVFYVNYNEHQYVSEQTEPCTLYSSE